jgi:hypothetical protein
VEADFIGHCRGVRSPAFHSGAKGVHSGAREEKGLENGRGWRMVGAGEWSVLGKGRCWKVVGAGEWQTLENGRRWRVVGAG